LTGSVGTIANGGYCVDPSQCSSGYCDPDTNKCTIKPNDNSNDSNGIAKDCCPAGVKDQIEHGSIGVSVDLIDVEGDTGNCDTPATGYHGLDEFRCPNVIAGDEKAKSFCTSKSIEGFIEAKVQANSTTITVIDQSKWKQLNLLQQLTYLKGKIDEAQQSIQDDENPLDQAKTTLSSPQCYLTKSSIDFLKTYQNTDQKNKVVLTEKVFSDPVTKQQIDPAKYCTGFNYNNSNCMKKCDDFCPDSSAEALKLYQQCGQCDPNAIVSTTSTSNGPDHFTDTTTTMSDSQLKDCLAKQETCIEKAYNDRPCTRGPNPAQKFSACISSCQDDCSSNCEKLYSSCSNEYDLCQNQCDNNSQCVLDNASKCLFNSSNFVYCASQNIDKDGNVDQGEADYCIKNAYLCKNGSDQYAGYQDCGQPKPVASLVTDTNGVNDCSQAYSASFFYDHPQCQKCAKPYGAPASDSVCSSKPVSSSKTNSSKGGSASCQDMCPETAKCPSSSSCPNCPCDQITSQNDQTQLLTIKFSVPDDNIGKYSVASRDVSGHQMSGPQCDQYSHDNDPLTFYCENNWWNNPNNQEGPAPVGSSRTCSQNKEIPVGQTVDNAEAWADTLKNNAARMSRNAQQIIGDMTITGKAKDTKPIQDYCKCNAKTMGDTPICTTNCFYWYFPGGYDDYGDYYQSSCYTYLSPCQGSPCATVTSFLNNLWSDVGSFKKDFINFYAGGSCDTNSDCSSGQCQNGECSCQTDSDCTFGQCQNGTCVNHGIITEPRSDILKELTYSRQSVNSCSVISNTTGDETKLFNCTRAEDELVPPINSNKMTKDELVAILKPEQSDQIDLGDKKTVDGYCYGTNLGKLFKKTLTDNWFCCQSQ